jgi:hypothetical protein
VFILFLSMKNPLPRCRRGQGICVRDPRALPQSKHKFHRDLTGLGAAAATAHRFGHHAVEHTQIVASGKATGIVLFPYGAVNQPAIA